MPWVSFTVYNWNQGPYHNNALAQCTSTFLLLLQPAMHYRLLFVSITEGCDCLHFYIPTPLFVALDTEAVLKSCLSINNFHSLYINSPVDRLKQISFPRWNKRNWTDYYSKKKIIKCSNKLWTSNEKKHCYVSTLVYRMILFYWGKFFFISPNNPDHANEYWRSVETDITARWSITWKLLTCTQVVIFL